MTVKMRRGLTPAGRDARRDGPPPRRGRRRRALLPPRAAAEEYEGRADHRVTAEVVAAVDVPVIASGDIVTPGEARRVLEDTGCAAVAVGRGALGYPWAFGDILAGVARPRPDMDEVVDEITAFAADARVALGESRACGYMRKFYGWYLAGHDLPPGELEALLTTPTLDGALARLRSLAAAPAAA